MRELYETVYQSRPPVIDSLLCSGTYLFAGAPKVGKSFLVAQLAYHVSTGQKLWEYDVRPGTVLYLALEDDYQRLQERMFRMFGVEETDKLHFATYAKQLGNGLDEQLDKFVREPGLSSSTPCRRFGRWAVRRTATPTTIKSSAG